MCPISGGNWNNGATAGVWALNLNNVRSNSNDNVGFRADSATLQNAIAYSRAKGDAFRRASIIAAKSVCLRLSGSTGRCVNSGCREGQAQFL
jgi:hypothetical protein